MELTNLLPLALLNASDGQRVNGRTRFQKLVFLAQERLELDEEPFKFIPYDYGPFSKALLARLERLEKRGFIEIDEERTYGGSNRYTYRLTGSGGDHLDESAYGELETEVVRVATEVVEEFDDVMLFELLDHVYDRYPKYRERSVLY